MYYKIQKDYVHKNIFMMQKIYLIIIVLSYDTPKKVLTKNHIVLSNILTYQYLLHRDNFMNLETYKYANHISN